ncbi:MAG TPA: 50S ribosomal protein L32 [Candidatus Sumerlaeota bacterium]|nr:50S ribosomal protein L32 [Candidatus Sumerlaeota bacterium]
MPVPRRRHGRSRQGKDRSQKQIKAVASVRCESCGAPKLAHRVCQTCGEYKKVKVKKVDAKA